jgi:hypothetical protein
MASDPDSRVRSDRLWSILSGVVPFRCLWNDPFDFDDDDPFSPGVFPYLW